MAGATARYRRATVRVESVLHAFGVALGGEAGSRLAGSSGVAVGGDALLRLPGDAVATRRAYRDIPGACSASMSGRGDGPRRHGSVRVDLEAGRPIDWREDRSAGTRAAWWQEHPGVEIVVRDRSRSRREEPRWARQQLWRWSIAGRC